MKRVSTFGFFILSIFVLSGCATIVKGTTQNIAFSTNPEGATCTISRIDDTGDIMVLYKDIETPTTLENLQKDDADLMIVCNKPGYKETVIHTSSSFQSMTFGNIIVGGIIGLGVDAVSGAINEYPTEILIPLDKE